MRTFAAMKHLPALLLLLISALAARAQHVSGELPAYDLRRDMPPGNYSGLAPIGTGSRDIGTGLRGIGTGRYAVVDDKSAADGFHVITLCLDTLTGAVRSVTYDTFRHDSLPARDAEGIAPLPWRGTLAVSAEGDNAVIEYDTLGRLTGRRTPTLLDHSTANGGLEALCADTATHSLLTMEESAASGQLRLLRLDERLRAVSTSLYPLSPPTATARPGSQHIHGVSDIALWSPDTLLVLEREAYIPKSKIGAWATCRLFAVALADLTGTPHPDGGAAIKRQLWATTTRMTLLRHDFANYEGLAFGPHLTGQRRTLLLIADSQARYKGVLRDLLKVLVIE